MPVALVGVVWCVGMLPIQSNLPTTNHELLVDGRTRSYLAHVPPATNDQTALVFVFHGGGGRQENMVRLGFGPLGVKENFITVYPQAWQSNWNDGRQASALVSQREGVDDVKFVRAIVEDLTKRLAFHRGRIFATGASNGGIFSHYLAAKASDLFAGIAPVIGGLAEPVAATFAPKHPISLLIIQGDADPLVPIDGGTVARNRGRVISTEKALELYAKHNGVTGEPTTRNLPDRDPEDGTTTEIRTYPTGREGVRMEYYRVKGGGHTFPGTARLRRSDPNNRTSQDFGGVEVIWAFFKSCPPRQ